MSIIALSETMLSRGLSLPELTFPLPYSVLNLKGPPYFFRMRA